MVKNIRKNLISFLLLAVFVLVVLLYYEATRRIRALNFPNAKTIPVIAMTANVFREDIEKCLEADMNDHVGNPLAIEEVLDKLYMYL